MEIEGFDMIMDTLTLAKELHEIDRYDIVQTQFSNALCYDTFYDNILGTIDSIFSICHNDYSDEDEYEIMVFEDEAISEYYRIAWEHGKLHKLHHEDNPYVIEARRELSRWLGYCYSVGWKILEYTKTKKTAMQSKLVIYSAPCECCGLDRLAYSLIQVQQFFAGKCAEHNDRITMKLEEGAVAA